MYTTKHVNIFSQYLKMDTNLTLTVPVTAIDALRYFETG